MDWGLTFACGIAGLAGAIGGSAKKGDRLRDIPAVFRRNPSGYIFAFALAAAAAALFQLT